MRTGEYLAMLCRNRFAIHPARFPLAMTVGAISVFNVVGSAVQSLLLGKKIDQTEIEHPPVFIVGHWRTGTTWLHEMLTLDSRFAFPSSYDCFAPHHFLISKRICAPLMKWFLPPRRPMDDMPVSPSLPQEDEFALCALGAHSPYRRIAFPNHGFVELDMLNFDAAPAGKIEQFRQHLMPFVRALSYAYPGRPLVFKSPTHTGRIRLLSEWFPGAKFIHLSRDPHQVFGSTVRLWRSLDLVQGLQIPRYSNEQLERSIVETLRQMYNGYLAQRESLGPDRLVEVRYEDLVVDPEAEMMRIYGQLHLGEWDDARRQTIGDFLRQRGDHRSQSALLDGDWARRIRTEWADYFSAFGYSAAKPRSAIA
jgi:hypothetical protein